MRLVVTTIFTTIVWASVLIVTPPESEKVLEKFVRKVRPSGPGWQTLRKRFDIQEAISISDLLIEFCLASGILYGGLLGIGAFLLHQELGGWIGLIVCIGSFFMMKGRDYKNLIPG